MADQLGIYKQAAQILKLRTVVSLTENTPTRTNFDDAYNDVVAYMIEQAAWRFAMRSVGLEPETSVTPQFGYQFYFKKPDDYVRIGAISMSPYLEPTLDDFAEEGAYWLANCDPLYIAYVSNDPLYGMDLGRWTPTFTRAVSYELANRTVGFLTKFGNDDIQRISKECTRALHNAKTKDAINQAGMRPPMGNLVRARFGTRFMGPRGGGYPSA